MGDKGSGKHKGARGVGGGRGKGGKQKAPPKPESGKGLSSGATKALSHQAPGNAGGAGSALQLRAGAHASKAAKGAGKKAPLKKAAPTEMDALRGLLASAASGSKLSKLSARTSITGGGNGGRAKINAKDRPGFGAPQSPTRPAKDTPPTVTSPPPTTEEKAAFANMFQNFVAQSAPADTSSTPAAASQPRAISATDSRPTPGLPAINKVGLATVLLPV